MNPLTIKEIMPDHAKSGWKPGLQRSWRITRRSIPTWYIISYITGGWIPGPLTSASNLYDVIANSKVGQMLAEAFGEDACNALYNITEGIVDCKTITYEVEKVILENAKKVDCKVLLQKSDEEILKDLYGENAIEDGLRVLIKEKYEEKKGSAIAYDTLNSYMKEIKLALETIKSTDGSLEKKLTKEISNQRDLCVDNKVREEAVKSGYEFSKMKDSDDTPRGGGGSQGTELPQF